MSSVSSAFRLLLFVLTVAPQLSSGQVVGTETFSYANGSIAGRTGGTGFNYNAFTQTVTATTSDWDVTAGTPTVTNGKLVTDNAGARREYNGPTEGTGSPADDTNNDHARSGAIRATGQVFYRFTMNRAAGNGTWGGVSTYSFNNERVFFGVPSGGGGTDTIGIDQSGVGATLGNINLTDGTTYTLVAVIDYTNQLLGLFVNPGQEDFWNPADGSNNADVTRAYTTFSTTTTADWSTAVRLASGASVTWDDLTVSLDAAGVGLLTTVPDLDSDGLPGYWEALYSLSDTDDGTIGENPPGAKNGPNGALGDPDDDGITNAEEYAAGTNPQSNDSDSDGFTDTLEFAVGTNPSNPASYPGADPMPGLVGVENFTYPNGSFNGQKAGTHWDFDNSTLNDGFVGHTKTSAVWSVSGNPQINAGVLVTQNGSTARREYNGPGAADEQSGAVGGEVTQAAHTVYYRFQMTRRSGASWGGASSYDFGGERYLFGVPGAANPASGQLEFAIHDLTNNVHAYSGVQPVVGQTYLLVAKIDYDANVASLYVDPDLALPETSNTPFASYNFTVDYWSTAIRLGSGGSGNVEWDGIRVTHDWQALQTSQLIANNDSMTLSPGGQARLFVGANDTGANPYTVTILSGPANGTATVDEYGGVLYQHTALATTSDSFTYQISSSSDETTAMATVNVAISGAARFDTDYVTLPDTPPAAATGITDAFPGLTFDSPHGFCTVPGDNKKLFVTEGDGRVYLIPDITANPASKILIVDLSGQTNHDNNEKAFKGITVHPNWGVNGYIYVTYNTTAGTSRLSRLTCQTTAPFSASPASELILINQTDPGDFHNVGTCKFGSDGYLYVGFGDGGTQSDGYSNSQYIDKNLWSGILRIDVDKKPGNLIPNPNFSGNADGTTPIPRVGGGSSGEAHFRIPADNPFIGTTSFNGVAVDPAKVRTELYVVGLRNPWQFSVEDLDQNGTVDEIWVGDVGRNDREEIGVYQAGDNGGWSWKEGTFTPGGITGDHNGAFEGNATLVPPLWEYTHGGGTFQGNSVTGGFIYRGTALPSLTGKYIFADYVSGHVWSLERTTPAPTVERIDGEAAIVGMITDPATGDVLLLDRGNTGTNQGIGGIKRLTLGTNDAGYPQSLSETNFFADLTNLSPNPGGVGYTPNLRFWSDFAEKSRWFLIRNSVDSVSYSRDDSWSFPEGMIWVKHFDYPTQWETFSRIINGSVVTDRRPTPGSPRRRVETRFLVRTASGSYGLSYRWNHLNSGTQNDAALASKNGESFDIPISLNGSPTVAPWQIPSRNSCINCHTPEAGHALSFNTRQLNTQGSIGNASGNFLNLLSNNGYLAGLTDPPATLPRHLRPDETTYSLEARVRSYLAVNCAYCHQAGGTGGGNWDGRAHLTLSDTGLVNGVPVDAPLVPDDLLVLPGNVSKSILYNRTAAANGYSRMPPLATNVIDLEGAQLLSDWIAGEVQPQATYQDWRIARFGSGSSPEGASGFDADGDGADNHLEWLTNTNPTDSTSVWQPLIHRDGNNIVHEFTGLGNRSAIILRSSDLNNWTPWQVPGNDGIPLAPGTLHSFSGPILPGREFFRFEIQER